MVNVQTPVPQELIDNFDPMTLYGEICTGIRETDQISFKLLGFVPIASGAGSTVLSLLLENEIADSVAIVLISLLGLVATFAFYRWELRNIQTCNRLLERAALLEKKSFGLGDLVGKPIAPTLLGRRMGKTEAERMIYGTSMAIWLVPVVMVLIR